MNGQDAYTSMDACVVCGCYLPEGWGMVCPACQKEWEEQER